MSVRNINEQSRRKRIVLGVAEIRQQVAIETICIDDQGLIVFNRIDGRDRRRDRITHFDRGGGIAAKERPIRNAIGKGVDSHVVQIRDVGEVSLRSEVDAAMCWTFPQFSRKLVAVTVDELMANLERVSPQEAVRHERIETVIESTSLKAMYDVRTEHDFTNDPRVIQLGSPESLLRALVAEADH